MNLHEYQAKELFRDYGLPVSEGIAVDTAEEAVSAAKKIGGDKWVIKAQVHAGGRGVEKLDTWQMQRFPNLEVLWLNDNKISKLQIYLLTLKKKKLLRIE